MFKQKIASYALGKIVNQDVAKNVKALIASGLEQFDVVSREEFELQSRLLADTRAELDGLKKRIEAFEKNS